MTWVDQRLTSILYGAGAGLGLLMLAPIPVEVLAGAFVALGAATELYRGHLVNGDDGDDDGGD